MRRILEKRVLPVLAAVCLLVTMVAVAMSFASADNGDRLNNWQGYITTELLINGSDRSNADADGNYLKLSETELYVGDSIRTNGQWMNYDLNYTNGGDSATGKVSGMQNWYCDGE